MIIEECGDSVIEYINLLKFGSCDKIIVDIYTKGNCYVLCKQLSLLFDVQNFYFLNDDVLGNHFITQVDNKYYDIRGCVNPTDTELKTMMKVDQNVINNMLVYGIPY